MQRTLEYAKGHQSFREAYYKEHEQEFARLAREGQAPKAIFIGCSDSRIMPHVIASTKPGDLFLIRTAGNFVPNYDPSILWDGVAATLEYGVEVLGIKDIIVCGHSHCGAIQGLFREPTEGPQLALVNKWLRFGQAAKEIVLRSVPEDTPIAEKCRNAEFISVIYQLEHLLTYPFIKEKVKAQKLFLHGWYFDIASGKIWYYDPEAYKFFPLG